MISSTSLSALQSLLEMFSSIVQIFLTWSKGPWKYCMDNQLHYSIGIPCNRSFPNYLWPHFQSESCFIVTVRDVVKHRANIFNLEQRTMKILYGQPIAISIEIYRDVKGSPLFLLYIIFNLKCVFPAPFLTTHTPNNLHSITYYENNVQSPIWIYPITARPEDKAIFFTCLNCILLIKFHFATLDFAPPHGISL